MILVPWFVGTALLTCAAQPPKGRLALREYGKYITES